MDDLLDIFFQVILDGGTAVIEQYKLSRKKRIIFCTFITLIIIVFIAFLIWIFLTNESIWIREIDFGAIIFFVCYLISLWRKIVLSKK